MTHTDYDADAIAWDQVPPRPVVRWQAPDVRLPSQVGLTTGLVTLAVCAAGAFALGLLLSERLNERSPIRWR